MKYILFLLIASASLCLAQGYHYVSGYISSNGVFVPGHYETNPNGNPYDNWSTRGNYNPFTGQPGTVNPINPGGHYWIDSHGIGHWTNGN